jgi:superfamily II DNA or RNA helicase
VSYADFLARKQRTVVDSGRIVHPDDIHPSLFPHQAELVVWAVRKGRAAIWADTGLGKTRMQIEWARLTGERCLILAPLAVAHQTIREAAALDITVDYVRNQAEADASSATIVISNYERLHLFDPAQFGAVVLDESSILKAFSGTTKKALIKAFAATPWRLCCTATPAPNDIEELCNHAHFLGVMTPSEMRSTFFIADNRGQFMKYRIKGHAKTAFYRWLSTWAAAIRTPSDLGHPDDGYILPDLDITARYVESDYTPEGQLFIVRLQGVREASAVRRTTVRQRCAAAAELVAAESGEPWLIYCGRNDEADLMETLVPGAVQVAGSDDPEDKARRLAGFADGTVAHLVSKVRIAGYGMNFQRCARIVFVGLGYSFEDYYQAIRRCWRFGQTRPVHVHLVLADVERDILDAVLDKEQAHRKMTAGLMIEMGDLIRAEVLGGTSAGDSYEPRDAVRLPVWLESESA